MRKAVLENTVFGRVTPNQKRKFVRILKEAGHTVAMTGDGINDVLALKDADCSIAMASGQRCGGTGRTAGTAGIRFFLYAAGSAGRKKSGKQYPEISQSVSGKKHFFTAAEFDFLCVLFAYPLEPSQVSLISMFTIGAPAFFLALEPNKNRIQVIF